VTVEPVGFNAHACGLAFCLRTSAGHLRMEAAEGETCSFGVSCVIHNGTSLLDARLAMAGRVMSLCIGASQRLHELPLSSDGSKTRRLKRRWFFWTSTSGTWTQLLQSKKRETKKRTSTSGTWTQLLQSKKRETKKRQSFEGARCQYPRRQLQPSRSFSAFRHKRWIS
jgi:hypothetical protein